MKEAPTQHKRCTDCGWHAGAWCDRLGKPLDAPSLYYDGGDYCTEYQKIKVK